MRTPLPPGSHVLLVVPDPGATAPPREQNHALAGELIINGHRYHLVPAEPSASPMMEPASDARLLTSRELQVVSCVCAGWGNKQIASKLHISTWTVAAHLRRIFVKLGVDTRAAMVSRCLGTVSLPSPP
ncbi:response regulator transcription factor [Corallococcus aberystwythensis]|uniref:LuxR family transcriptional regulator n=1 Tax=Corallococcus aberystwythensis TaxID=2316722 RepID=A0A3A8QJ87_9BACT|nr:helix-turn-helix transcriptional regulator [Corallococcus aberystwythensis]RKH67781.1 LuxR family transcriptional regulator [Corallococcus aberystwythensis]